ncbi:hypothetical protein ACF07B_20420 [Streptomyces sp. NPDC015532]|uniref:hypothetical protein n=1 Tax=Streptomyces sp. NPDC015532 TaxID=3364960 RepID=UPI0036FD9CBF
MAIEWDRIGQPAFDRYVEALLHRMFDDGGPVIVVNGRGGDGIDLPVTAEVGLRIFQLKCHPDGFPGSLKGRRASINKSFNRAMAHTPVERTLSPGRGRIAHPACLLLHSRQGNRLISTLGLLTQTNRPLPKLHVPTHSRRKIDTDKPIQLNRSTRAGVLKGGAGREAPSVWTRCRHLRLSP